MSRISLYRTLVVSTVITGALAFGGCATGGMNAKTASKKGNDNWNLARVAIIYQLAETQYKVGDYDKCTETLHEALATKAQFSPMYVLAAKVDIERGNLEPAANNLNVAIRIKPDDPEPYYLLGVLYQRWQKQEAACDYYKQAWNKKIDEVRYMLAVVEMEISLGRLEEAQTTLESKLVYFEQSAAVRVALARIASLRNDYTTACKYYRDAVVLMPDEKNLQRSYAEALFYAGQYANSALILEDIRTQSDLKDKGNVAMLLGQCYLATRKFHEARNCFQEAIRETPNDNLAYINLGKACLQTGELGLSLSAARKVLHEDPQNIQAMIITALVAQKQQKWADAAAILEKAVAITPHDTTVLCMLGINAQQRGNHEQAVAFYEKAAEVNPQDPWAAELLGRPVAAQVQAQPAEKAGEKGAEKAADKAGDDFDTAPAAANAAVSNAAPISAVVPVREGAMGKAP